MFWAKGFFAPNAVAKARAASGATSWTICSIARPRRWFLLLRPIEVHSLRAHRRASSGRCRDWRGQAGRRWLRLRPRGLRSAVHCRGRLGRGVEGVRKNPDGDPTPVDAEVLRASPTCSWSTPSEITDPPSQVVEEQVAEVAPPAAVDNRRQISVDSLAPAAQRPPAKVEAGADRNGNRLVATTHGNNARPGCAQPARLAAAPRSKRTLTRTRSPSRSRLPGPLGATLSIAACLAGGFERTEGFASSVKPRRKGPAAARHRCGGAPPARRRRRAPRRSTNPAACLVLPSDSSQSKLSAIP